MKLTYLLLLSVAVTALAQNPIVTSTDTPKPTNLQLARDGSILIYESSAKPCDPPKANSQPLFPLGSSFVAGITSKDEAGIWTGWKFLITAKHVLNGRTSVIVRLNSSKGNEFRCFALKVITSGEGTNAFEGGNGIDLIAVSLPDFPDVDPTILPMSLIASPLLMKEKELNVGTPVSTVGYLFGYSGIKQNYPVTKFGHISVLTDEKWFHNPVSQQDEQAYIIELQNTPGLSGAPVITTGFEFKTGAGAFKYRELSPYLIGVVKGLLTAPAGSAMISQGVAAIEPADNLRNLLLGIAESLKRQGHRVLAGQ